MRLSRVNKYYLLTYLLTMFIALRRHVVGIKIILIIWGFITI